MLQRKLARDVWRLRYQVFTIALVVGCGMASLVAAVTASASLRASRDAFYDEAHFGDIFVRANRAPRPMLDRLRSLPGVAAVEGRVVDDFRMEVDESSEPLTGRFVSLTWPAEGRLNQLQIRSGRQPEPGSSDEVVLSDAFAEAWGLQPGASVSAVINGHRAKLRVVGVGISPEFVYPPSRTGLADPRHLGIVWMDEDALAKATGLTGAFNDFSVQLAVGADTRETIDRVDALLEPYGGLGAVGREDQLSSKLVDQKIGQLAKSAVLLPAVFLGVAAFLLNVLISRIVGTQREQIATLKALGYRSRELAMHYLELGATICALGILFGIALGLFGARAMLTMYAMFFRFPALGLRFDVGSVAVGVLVTCLSALGGSFFAVRRAVSIPPAEAMRPEAPPTFHATWLDRAYRLVAPAMRMVLRDVQRRPVRLLLSAASIALATAIVVAGSVALDSVNETLRLHFEVSHREDVTVTLDRARPWRAARDLGHIPGVVRAEGERQVPVRLRAGPRARTTTILGLPPGADLHRLLDVRAEPLALRAGLSLSRPLGELLGVRAGDDVEVDVLELGRRKARVPVAAIVDDLIGLSGYMQSAELDRVLDEAPAANVVLLEVEHRDLDDVMERLRALPAVATVSRPELDRGLLHAEVADVYLVMQIILALFASAIAVGVVYNNARIALEVRSRDLATLRILGFTRGELAVVLLGEQALQVLLGIAPGIWLGRWMGASTLASIDRELIRIPFAISPASEVAAACVVTFAALVSSLVVRSRSDRLDLVAVLKARD
jgi:putative ABC transport system permease protein